MKRRLIALALAAGAVVAPLAASMHASAAPTTYGQITGNVVINKADPTKASVKVTYRCTTADTTSPHSFISYKQVGSRKSDPNLMKEGSSQLAISTGGAWAMSHRNTLVCDSTVRTQVLQLDQIETASFGVPVRPFKPGFGWVQFCIFDDNYPIPAPPADPESGVPYDANVMRLAA